MRSKVLFLIASFFLAGCTIARTIQPLSYNPTVLKRNSASVLYYIDPNLKTLTEIHKSKTISYRVEAGHSLYGLIKDMFQSIFYDAKEIEEISNQTVPVIAFTKGTSELKIDPTSKYTYSIKIAVVVQKPRQRPDEIIVTGNYTLDEYFRKQINILATETPKYICEQGIRDAINKIGEVLMNYKF